MTVVENSTGVHIQTNNWELVKRLYVLYGTENTMVTAYNQTLPLEQVLPATPLPRGLKTIHTIKQKNMVSETCDSPFSHKDHWSHDNMPLMYELSQDLSTITYSQAWNKAWRSPETTLVSMIMKKIGWDQHLTVWGMFKLFTWASMQGWWFAGRAVWGLFF
jgi:hypothetical protein